MKNRRSGEDGSRPKRQRTGARVVVSSTEETAYSVGTRVEFDLDVEGCVMDIADGGGTRARKLVAGTVIGIDGICRAICFDRSNYGVDHISPCLVAGTEEFGVEELRPPSRETELRRLVALEQHLSHEVFEDEEYDVSCL